MKTYTKTGPIALKFNQDKGPEPVSNALRSNLLFEAHAVSAGRTNLALVLLTALRRRSRREVVSLKPGTDTRYEKHVGWRYSEAELRLVDQLFPKAFNRGVYAAASDEDFFASLMRPTLEPKAPEVFTEGSVSADPFDLAAGKEQETRRNAVNAKLAKAGLGACECDGAFRCGNCAALDGEEHRKMQLLDWLIDYMAEKQGLTRDEYLRSRRGRREALDIFVTVYATVAGMPQVDVAAVTGWSEETVSKRLRAVKKTWPELGLKDSSATTSPQMSDREAHPSVEAGGFVARSASTTTPKEIAA